MAKQRLLYVAPHLSTGGLPQYLLKQIEHFKSDFEIEVVELNNVGGDAFVVQKNKIKELVPLHTLGSNKEELLDIISEFKPNIIHFQEIPQHDISFEILDKIWDNKRDYFIVASTHGSLTSSPSISVRPCGPRSRLSKRSACGLNSACRSPLWRRWCRLSSPCPWAFCRP